MVIMLFCAHSSGLAVEIVDYRYSYGDFFEFFLLFFAFSFAVFLFYDFKEKQLFDVSFLRLGFRFYMLFWLREYECSVRSNDG